MNAPTTEQFLDYKKSLACIHCGLCLSSCPTYLETGNENDSPRGRIYLMRALQNGKITLSDTAVRHIDLCLGCRACEAACPSGVHYGELLESTRDHIEKKHERSMFQTFLRKVAIEKVFPFPNRMKAALIPAQLTRALHLEWAMPKFARDALSLIPRDFSTGRLPEISPATGPTKRGRVGFVRGCVMNVMFGETNEATIWLLNHAGYDVFTPPDQTCCGALYSHNGNLAQARDSARKNVTAFGNYELDAIVINAAGCGSTLKEYGHLLHDDADGGKGGEGFSAKVKDITEFLTAAFDSSHFAGTKVPFQKITYHDACHLCHAQRISKPPRELVKAVAREKFVELPESEICCGSAGSYNLTEPEMAERLQHRKTQNIVKTGADCVVTTNPGCILQMRAGLKRAGANVTVLHISDFLKMALET
jgi:glycolate oxidase iron-sulfur subunit